MVQVSHQLPITRSEVTFVQFNDVRAKTFDHRTKSLAKGGEYRAEMSAKVEDFFQRTMKVIEQDVNAISSSDLSIRDVVAKEVQTPCIANLKIMIDSIIESSGYSISDCVSDGDGIVNTAARSFYAILDQRERDFNLEPFTLTNALFGRNIFTQGKAIVTRAQNQLNTKITSFDGFFLEISQKLNEVTGVYDEQVVILDSCLKSVESFAKVEFERVSKSLATCQKFSKA